MHVALATNHCNKCAADLLLPASGGIEQQKTGGAPGAWRASSSHSPALRCLLRSGPVCLLKVLYDCCALKHGHPGVGIFQVWRLEAPPALKQLLPLGAAPRAGALQVRQLQLAQLLPHNFAEW